MEVIDIIEQYIDYDSMLAKAIQNNDQLAVKFISKKIKFHDIKYIIIAIRNHSKSEIITILNKNTDWKVINEKLVVRAICENDNLEALKILHYRCRDVKLKGQDIAKIQTLHMFNFLIDHNMVCPSTELIEMPFINYSFDLLKKFNHMIIVLDPIETVKKLKKQSVIDYLCWRYPELSSNI